MRRRRTRRLIKLRESTSSHSTPTRKSAPNSRVIFIEPYSTDQLFIRLCTEHQRDISLPDTSMVSGLRVETTSSDAGSNTVAFGQTVSLGCSGMVRDDSRKLQFTKPLTLMSTVGEAS